MVKTADIINENIALNALRAIVFAWIFHNFETRLHPHIEREGIRRLIKNTFKNPAPDKFVTGTTTASYRSFDSFLKFFNSVGI